MPKLLFLLLLSVTLQAQDFSKTEIQADLLILKEKIEKIHPNPYKFIAKSQFQQVFDSLNRIEKPLAVKQTFAHFLQLSKAIRCGHSYILPDERLIPPSNRNPKFLPFDLVIFENRLYVSKNFSDVQNLQKGLEIIEIEGISSEKLIKNLSKYAYQNADGINTEADEYYIQRNFRKLLHIYLGEQDELVVKSKKETLKIKTKTLNQIREIEDERYPIRNVEVYKNMILKKINDSVSLLRIRSFEGNEYENGNFQQETLNIFKEISQNQTKNLIIDLRNNAGGRMDYADEVLKYLLNRPYQSYQISSKREIKEIKKDLTIKRFYEPSNPKPYFYDGKLAVLINEGTFSAAVYMASHLQNAKIGTFIGTTCGGSADGTSAGEFINFTLPNTRFTVSLPTQKVDYNASKSLQLQPNYVIKQTFEDFLKNEDTVLNFACLLKK